MPGMPERTLMLKLAWTFGLLVIINMISCTCFVEIITMEVQSTALLQENFHVFSFSFQLIHAFLHAFRLYIYFYYYGIRK